MSPSTLTPFRRLGPRVSTLVVAITLAAACSSDANTIELTDGRIEAPSGGAQAQDQPLGTSPVDFRYDTLDGGSAALSELGDKPVVLNFFASWCPSCITEMPDFEAVHQARSDEVDFLGLALQDRAESAEALIERTGVTFSVGTDDDGRIFELFQGIGMPTTVFIDSEGVVRLIHSGVLTEDALSERIDELLVKS